MFDLHYEMGRWFLMLPDILVFFAIFGFGFLVGCFTVILFVLYHVVKGNTLTIKKEEI